MTDTTLARALDLTRAVTDILSKGGAIGGLIGHVMKWLAREGIPEGEFAYCLEKSKALIYPNDNGLKIRSRLRESDARLKAKPYVAGLRLVNALSIGRWMADDPDYCYLVTTVAALFTNHDMSYASEVVCDMLLDEGKQEEANRKSYRYEKDRLLPVVKKIVESIILNVVNCSGNFDRIPAELLGICSHHTDSHTFAAAAMAISRSSGDVVIRCNRFLADLYVWLLAHIEGKISISIAGKIIHRANSGRSLRSVTMLADEACPADHGEVATTIVISTNVGGTLSTMLKHTADHVEVGGTCLNIRQPLYELVGYKCAGWINKALTPQESRQICIAGQRIVRWLMARPVLACHDSRIVYSTSLGDKPDGISVGSLLSRWPAICNRNFGPGTSEYSFDLAYGWFRGGRSEARVTSIRDMLNCFPHARVIIEHACARCRCTSCRTEVSRTGKDHEIVSKPGCLAYLAEDHLCLIIAHAVADGFGIPDASNLRDFSEIRRGVENLMFELLHLRRIAWETWFSLAACIYLGCEWSGTTAQAGNRSAELVAVQHGSEVVVAPWVDLHSELASQGSFGCLVATGQLCDMGIGFGILHTEETSPPAGTSSNWKALWKAPESHSMTTAISEISLQTTITVISEPLFKLTTIARVGNYLRIINPATVMLALYRRLTPKCKDLFHGAPAQNHQMWSVEDALGLWEKRHPYDRGVAVVDTTTRCIANKDEFVTLNILMALSPGGYVLKRGNCCLTCAIAQGRDQVPQRILCVPWTSVHVYGGSMQLQNLVVTYSNATVIGVP
jgi:hypothetical protein